MYIKQILFVIEGLIRVLGGECLQLPNKPLWACNYNNFGVTHRFPSPGKVGQNPQSQTTQAG